jgi:hypothetical protein
LLLIGAAACTHSRRAPNEDRLKEQVRDLEEKIDANASKHSPGAIPTNVGVRSHPRAERLV